MKGNKNLFTTIIVVLGFMVMWDHFVVSRYSPKKSENQSNSVVSNDRGAVPQTKTALVQQEQTNLASIPTALPIKGTEESVVLRGENAEVTMGTKGARVKSWRLHEGDHWINVVADPQGKENKDPREVLEPYVFPLETYPELNFTVQSASKKDVVLVADHPQGFRVTKQITLDSQPFLNSVSVSYTNLGSRDLPMTAFFGWGEGLGKRAENGEYDEKQEQMVRAEMRAVALNGEDAKTWKPGFIRNKTIDRKEVGKFKWAGVDNDHFLAAFIPLEEEESIVHIVANKKQAPRLEFQKNLVLKPGETVSLPYLLYVGPKKLSLLEEVGFELNKSVDFGFFGIISKILLTGLNFFQSITGNYGWAIIILTICIQILFFPLTKKSLQHSVRMKEVQPQIKKLQAQLKGDPKRLQIETFNLYKKNGMKFMGMEGCFPMLVQIPIFFAFYRTLRIAFELRGAPWIFWIVDLSMPDPIYILPVLMGIGMLFQQKLTAVAMDPAQAKMMMFMPIMFTFFFLKLPAGLVLYWVVNSVSTIVAQKILQWQKHHIPKSAT